MNPWLQAAIAIIPTAVGGLLIYLQVTKQARIQARTAETVAQQSTDLELAKLELERRKMADEADQRARAIYAQLIEDMRNEVDRVHKTLERIQNQYDRVSDQLSKEQDVSNTLRNELRRWRNYVQELSDFITALDNHVKKLGVQVPADWGRPPRPPERNA